VEIEEFKKRALEGEMILAYVDEVGFAKAHPNRGVMDHQRDKAFN
jgi:hypothetical protein